MARMVAAGMLSLFALAGVAWVVACQIERPQKGRADHHLGAPAVVVVETTDILAPVTTPELRAGDAMTPGATHDTSARVTAAGPARSSARRATANAPPHSLGRRVARFITGDGRHQVRPFPTLNK
jgi:hypothetical protein